jgi:REP element-mobilizing transposase RayT
MYNPAKHHLRPLRLTGYDYSQTGAYFVTICTENRACLFGAVVEGEMQLNDAGRMVEHCWFELNRKFSAVETDEFVIMPNHCHGIIIITDRTVGADLCLGPAPMGTRAAHQGADAKHRGAHTGAPLRPRLSTVIQWFKTMTTNQYIRSVKTGAWPRSNRQLWQRNYYEHVIRNEESLNRIRQYILDTRRDGNSTVRIQRQ